MQSITHQFQARQLASRLLAASLAFIAALGLAWLVQQQQPAPVAIAQQMQGESWYRIDFGEQHVGYMHNRTSRDHRGRWHFESTTHFMLNGASPNTITKTLVFAARPPFALTHASYANRGAAHSESVNIEPDGNTYQATLQRDNHRNTLTLDWRYDLTAFLEFEHWLRTYQPAPGAQHPVSSLDFERLQVNFQTYRVVERNDLGYLVEINAPLAATRTQLGNNLRPLWLNMAQAFDVTLASREEAIDLHLLPNRTTFVFPVDTRLDQHTELKELHLTVNGPDNHPLPKRLSLTYNPTTASVDPKAHRGEELQFPITHPRIRQLAQAALARTDVADPIEGLVRTAYEQLSYRDNRPADSVLAAIEQGYGECTDFADLFTTIARAAGYAARPVYGLAYRDGVSPAFMFHAWNEIHADGRWRAVDPTWNQVRVDATHIPLSDAQAATMMHANNVSGVSFQVIDTAYF